MRQAGDLAERALAGSTSARARPARASGPAAGAAARGRAAPRRARAGAGCASSCTSRADRSPSRGRSCASTAARSGARSPARRPRAAAPAARGGSARAAASPVDLGHVELRARRTRAGRARPSRRSSAPRSRCSGGAAAVRSAGRVRALMPPPRRPLAAASAAATAAPEHLGEPVDVGARAPLGDRDEQRRRRPRRSRAPSGDARVDARAAAALDAPLPTSARRAAARTRARPAASCSVSTPSSARERLARVVGAREQQLAELDEPRAAEPRQVDDAGERVQRLRGADVRRRLLAADVLLARLQRQHEAAPAVDVDGLARDAAGHPAQVLLASRRRSRTTGRRSRGGCRAAGPRRRTTSTPHSPGGSQDRRARSGRPRRRRPTRRPSRRLAAAQRRGVLDGAEKFGCCEERPRRCRRRSRAAQRVGVGDAVARAAPRRPRCRSRARRCAASRARAGAARRDATNARAAVVQLRQVAGGGDRARALVDRGVGDRQRGQLADRRLVLEHHLQPALGDLRLVGRVRRQELRARHQHVDRAPGRSGRTCRRRGS